MAGRAAFGRDYYDDIRALKRRGLTAEQIAKELGMSRPTVFRIINRYGRP